MDWRAISRSRSRISMDWRPTSRSRSRPPPPGQPFDQGNLSNSWSEGKFTFPPFGDLTPGGISRSFDTSFIPPNEHATSSSIPIPGIATNLRYGSPPPSSSLHSHSTHLAAVHEESAGLAGPHLMSYANAGGAQSGPSRLSHAGPFRQPLSTLESPSAFQPSSLPSSFGLQGHTRHRADASSSSDNLQGNLSRQLRKQSFDHSVTRSNRRSQDTSNGQADAFDPILVCLPKNVG